jgi:hypothetical protein
LQRDQQGPSDEQLRLGGLFWRLPATSSIGGFARLFLNQALLAAFLELILGDFGITVGIHHFEIDDERSRLVS